MVAVARRHYVEGVSRVDLARERGVSRFKISRLLAAAQEAGIVTIRISAPAGIDYELSERLRETYDLRRALVVPTADDVGVAEALGQVAGELLAEIVTADDVLGLDCGRTLLAMTGHLRGIARCEVVQLTGMGGQLGRTSVDIVRTVAEANGGGTTHPVFAPIVVADRRTATALQQHDSIRATLEQYPRVTKAVVAVGAWPVGEGGGLSQIPPLIGPAATEKLAARGVVGETCALLYDARGRRVTGLDERRIGITEAQLRAVPDVIAVAGGAGKTEAVRALLRAGLLGSLVTDAYLARRILED